MRKAGEYMYIFAYIAFVTCLYSVTPVQATPVRVFLAIAGVAGTAFCLWVEIATINYGSEISVRNRILAWLTSTWPGHWILNQMLKRRMRRRHDELKRKAYHDGHYR